MPTDEWNEVRENVKQRQMTEKNGYQKIQQNFGLSNIEEAVLEFIKEHPGTSKQRIVDYFDEQKLYSRVPIFRTTTSLVQYGMVIERKDSTNRQTCNLFINSESLLVSLINDFDNFEKGYQDLLKNAKAQFAEMGSLRKSYKKNYRQQLRQRPDEKEFLDDWYWETSERKIQGMEESKLYELLSAYKAFIFLHVFIALFKWPSVTSDPVTLTKLYAVLFTRIKELHPRILESIPGVFGRRRDNYFLATRAAHVMKIESLFRTFPRDNSKFIAVMDSMWNSVYEFLSWSKGCDKKELKDWKAVLDDVDK